MGKCQPAPKRLKSIQLFVYTVMSDPKIDDRYTEGVYYDATVGEFYEYDRSDDGESVTLFDPVTGEQIETLGAEEFNGLQPDLYPVPEEAVYDPVGYFENWIADHAVRGEFDVGRIWADYATEIVEVGEVND
jgi:hypothetical protein